MKNFIEKLKEDLIRDEGKKLDVYHDHLGYKTVGIGHLILKDDKVIVLYSGLWSFIFNIKLWTTWG